MNPAGMPIFDFAASDWQTGWFSINDGVMGGISRSEMVASGAGTAVFRGLVSLENSGGFASVRCTPRRFDLAQCAGLALRVRGDGQRYKLNLKAEELFDGVQYQAAFVAPKNAWTEVRLPFAGFAPTFRGRVLDGPPLDPAAVRTLGFMISDKQAGPFALEVAWVEGYGPG